MKGAVFYRSKYGSTAQYADWISEATSLPAHNLDGTKVSLADFDFLVLGCPVIYGVSANDCCWWDNSAVSYIGWVPKDNAEIYRAEVEAG